MSIANVTVPSSPIPLRRSAASLGLAAIASELDGEARADRDAGLQPAVDPVEAYAPKAEPPLPSYVAHIENATRTGMLSATVLVKEFEEVALELEQLGEDLRAVEKRAGEAATVLTEALEDLKATAQRYRDEAKRVLEEVEGVALKASEARAMCQELRGKL